MPNEHRESVGAPVHDENYKRLAAFRERWPVCRAASGGRRQRYVSDELHRPGDAVHGGFDMARGNRLGSQEPDGTPRDSHGETATHRLASAADRWLYVAIEFFGRTSINACHCAWARTRDGCTRKLCGNRMVKQAELLPLVLPATVIRGTPPLRIPQRRSHRPHGSLLAEARGFPC